MTLTFFKEMLSTYSMFTSYLVNEIKIQLKREGRKRIFLIKYFSFKNEKQTSKYYCNYEAKQLIKH